MTDEEFDPIVLHRRNNKLLTARDVLVAAYPGSGHALLGNVLLELGLNYCDPYTELFSPAGGSVILAERQTYRRRLAATAVIDEGRRRNASARFVKTHLYPSEFPSPVRGIVLLVRDPRDAIHSYYHWRLSFSEEGEKGSFEEFLDRLGPNGVPPSLDWTQFYRRWLAKRTDTEVVILRFEDLKLGGVRAIETLLVKFAAHIDRMDMVRAFEASSFDKMRAHEDHVSGATNEGRIMRRGMVDEWREWFSGPLRRRFDDPLLRETAKVFGYTEWLGEREGT